MQKFCSKMYVLLCVMILVQDIAALVNYCQIDPDHLLCKVDCDNYVRKNLEFCKEYKPVTLWAGWKDYVVEIHNKIRLEVVQGTVVGAGKKLLPPGKNMQKMKWDNLLECSSRVQVDKCKVTGSDKDVRKIDNKNIGEMFAFIRTNELNYPEDAKFDILNYLIREKTFENEIKNFPQTNVKSFTTLGLGQTSIAVVGQIIFNSNVLVGCAIASDEKGKDRLINTYITLVCHYGPVEVKDGDRLYDEYKDGDKYCDDSQDDNNPRLCDPKSGAVEDNYSKELYPDPGEPETTTNDKESGGGKETTNDKESGGGKETTNDKESGGGKETTNEGVSGTDGSSESSDANSKSFTYKDALVLLFVFLLFCC